MGVGYRKPKSNLSREERKALAEQARLAKKKRKGRIAGKDWHKPIKLKKKKIKQINIAQSGAVAGPLVSTVKKKDSKKIIKKYELAKTKLEQREKYKIPSSQQKLPKKIEAPIHAPADTSGVKEKEGLAWIAKYTKKKKEKKGHGRTMSFGGVDVKVPGFDTGGSATDKLFKRNQEVMDTLRKEKSKVSKRLLKKTKKMATELKKRDLTQIFKRPSKASIKAVGEIVKSGTSKFIQRRAKLAGVTVEALKKWAKKMEGSKEWIQKNPKLIGKFPFVNRPWKKKAHGGVIKGYADGGSTDEQKKVTYIKGKEAKKAYAKKVVKAETIRKRKENKEKKEIKQWRKALTKQQDSGTKLTRWIRKYDMKKFAERTGGRHDRGGPTYDYDRPEVQKKVTVIKTPKGKSIYKGYMSGKKWDERKKKREAKAEYYHKIGKAPLIRDLPGVPSKLHKLFNPKFKDKKKIKEQPIVKYKAKGGTVRKYATGGSTNGPLHRGWGAATKGTKFKGTF